MRELYPRLFTILIFDRYERVSKPIYRKLLVRTGIVSSDDLFVLLCFIVIDVIFVCFVCYVCSGSGVFERQASENQ